MSATTGGTATAGTKWASAAGPCCASRAGLDQQWAGPGRGGRASGGAADASEPGGAGTVTVWRRRPSKSPAKPPAPPGRFNLTGRILSLGCVVTSALLGG